MNRFFLLPHLLTGLPASGCLPLLASGFPRPMGLSNSFNKRGGKTVHSTEEPRDAKRHSRRVPFEPKHTVPSSNGKDHIEISRGDATR